MNCSEARDRIPEYLSGLLDDPVDLLEHIESCPACRRELEIYHKLDAVLSFPPMPPELPGEVINRIRAYRGGFASVGWDAITWIGAGLGVSLAVWFVMLTNLNSIRDILRFILAAL